MSEFLSTETDQGRIWADATAGVAQVTNDELVFELAIASAFIPTSPEDYQYMQTEISRIADTETAGADIKQLAITFLDELAQEYPELDAAVVANAETAYLATMRTATDALAAGDATTYEAAVAQLHTTGPINLEALHARLRADHELSN